MQYYQDITLLPDAEANLGFLWHKVFQQVHIALVENKIGANESAIAISIVHYGEKPFPLGDKLRLFADSEDKLNALDITKWLSRLTDYCHIKPVKKVPESITQYVCFKRKAVKSIQSKVERRAKHLDIPYQDALDYLLSEGKSTESKLPFINLTSQETRKRTGDETQVKFPLFIELTRFDKPVIGNFDCYGLSKKATVPWFR